MVGTPNGGSHLISSTAATERAFGASSVSQGNQDEKQLEGPVPLLCAASDRRWVGDQRTKIQS
eukprot:m.317465 g.317465  ORF g.317465 m.317465 type:complete len:63 (-) comp19688_c0_seq7:1007-1195(-)